MQSGSSTTTVKKWRPTGQTTAFEPMVCANAGVSCSTVGDMIYSCIGTLDGSTTKYAELECKLESITTYTYTWQLVQSRKSCTVCPPSGGTTDGEQCYCSSTDKVYEHTYSNTQTTVYYWQKVRDDTALALSIADIVKHVSGSITKKVLDDDTGSFKGYLETDVGDPFIYTLHDDAGKIIYSGFIKSWDYDEETKTVEFESKDFRNIFDTEIVLDYSHDASFDSRLSQIFSKIADAVSEESGSLNYEFVIPDNDTITTAVANYTDQYVIVNSKEFLKIYLLYYGYYLSTTFDPDNLTIGVIFNEASEDVIEIRLSDFTFSKTKTNIQSNHTIATIKFQTVYEVDSEWTAASEIDYTTAATEDKGELMADELPPLEGYTKDFVLKLLKGVHFEEITESEYNALSVKQEEVIQLTSGDSIQGEIVESRYPYPYNQARVALGDTDPIDENTLDPVPNHIQYIKQQDVPVGMTSTSTVDTVMGFMNAYEPGSACEFGTDIQLYWTITNSYGTWTVIRQACTGYIQYACPVTAPTVTEITANFDPTSLIYQQGLKVQFKDSNGSDCQRYRYVKVVADEIEYWTKGGTFVIPRPATLASKHYYLGSDNNIYSDTVPDELKLYPVKTKVFEYETLAKAQIEAIYELLNTRWNENIRLNDLKKPISLDLDFLQMIKVYDKNGYVKTLPVTEKSFTIEEIVKDPKIKLGFKKEFFTEIYNGNQTNCVVK